MKDIFMKHVPKMATLAQISKNDNICVLKSQRAITGEDFYEKVDLSAPIIMKDEKVLVPISFFKKVMHAYVSTADKIVRIERSGAIVDVEVCDENGIYVDVLEVLPHLNVDYYYEQDLQHVYVVVESKTAGPRRLTPSEEALPYAKYYHEYWETPLHERADVKAWASKFEKFQLTTMNKPEEMLHIHDVRKLLDPEFRKSEWKEGWTLFDDGSGVMCTRTEFPGTTKEMFQWWFAWHSLEDIRYMLWYPPAHYGIMPTLEYRKMVENPNLTLFEKTHGGNSVHLVYESTPIDSFSYAVAGAADWHSIPFQNPQKRGFLDSDLAIMEKTGCAAICGGARMLHFFAENEDGTGGTLYTHFWYGLVPDEKVLWRGAAGCQDKSLIQSILNIAQHATKEFAQLAHILPRLYSEEGKEK